MDSAHSMRSTRLIRSKDSIRPSTLVKQTGGSYARQLGIDLSGGDAAEIHKWFIAALLFGARISERIAEKTYRKFEQDGMLTARRMVDAGWDKLVVILDRGAYVRYDFKTATKLLEANRSLLHHYQGDLNVLYGSARDEADLEQRLRSLGKGIGGVTVNIFLRELRGIWPKADPALSERAIAAAKALGFVPSRMHDPAHILQALKDAWRADGMKPENFAEFDAALVRYETVLRKKTAHAVKASVV
ncbi:MAG TPA: hypothetical protein VM571_00570 [Noviherbaspirillum sp.]|nr:hypothetical protein [Noviherbaspirillum sp.]